MDSAHVNKAMLIHYWTDVGIESIDFTLAQAAIHSKFPGASVAVSPSRLKKGHILAQSMYLKQFKNAFPKGTFHICHVSMKSQMPPRFMVTEYEGQFFLGPDSGLFLLGFDKTEQAYFKIPNDVYTYKSLEEIYLPTIQKIIDHNFILHNALEPKTIFQNASMIQPTFNGNILRLTVVYKDFHGNLFFNIQQEEFEEFRNNRSFKFMGGSSNTIGLQLDIDRISRDYDDVYEGEILALFSYGNHLQIAQNAGEAARSLGLVEGSIVAVKFE